MLFDVVLPSLLTAITITSILLFRKLEPKMKTLFEEREFRTRDALFIVIAMGTMVTIIALVPSQAIQILFLVAYSVVLFLFTYIPIEKWYLAVLPPIVFGALYFSQFWNFILIDVFAIFFAISISVYLATLFSWNTVLVFAALIAAMDVIQVFGTRFMVDAATKIVDLKLPVLIQVPTFPRQGYILLGLGDIFLGGLLAIQSMQRFNRKAGIITAFAIGIAFFIFETAVFSTDFARFFPATIVVISGWLLSLGVNIKMNRKTTSVS